MTSFDTKTFYSPDNGTIFLPVGPVNGLPKKVHHQGEVFYRTPRLAVTVCSLAKIVGLERPSQHRSQVLHTIARHLAINNVTFGGFTEQLSLCKNDDSKSKSIIAGAEVLGLSEWVKGVRQDASTSLPLPYPYVTLYTRGDAKGIPINGLAELNKRCEVLTMPELQTVLQASS